MNSEVPPLIVALVLTLTAVAIGTWMWGSGAAANIGGPAELRTDANGHVFVQIQDALIEHDADGAFLKTHDLTDLGVESFFGGYAFFSNGDILLRRGPDPRSFADNLRAFQRKTNKQSLEPMTPDSGLFRCDLASRDCVRFGSAGIDFKAAHGLFIDWRTDNVYISDTTRHLLRKYSADGTVLAGPAGGFSFPNQLLMHNEQLYVADTNHHEIRILSSETASFGADIDRKNVVSESASAARQTWPSHFARVGTDWWVNNMRTGMNQGGVYVFDSNWRPVRELILPPGSDPVSLLAVGNEVWISDWYNDKVRRFSATGEELADLDSAGLEQILASSRVERARFEIISYSGIGLIALVLAGLMLRAFAVGMSNDAAKTAAETGRGSAPNESLHLEPDAKALRRMAIAARFFSILLLILAGLVAYIALFRAKPEFGIQWILPGIGMIAINVLIVWVNRANKGTAISIEGNTVTLRDSTGKDANCSIEDVRYNDTAIATPEIAVFLGQPMASVYRRKDLKERLFPRLADAQRVSALQMQQILFRFRHPQGLTAALALFALLVYAGTMLI